MTSFSTRASLARIFLPLLVLEAGALAQSSDTAASRLADLMDAARFGTAAAPDSASVRVDGTFTFSFGGEASDGPINGTWWLVKARDKGAKAMDFTRFGVVRQGYRESSGWEVHPVTGARHLDKDGLDLVRRCFALIQWPGWRSHWSHCEFVEERMLGGRTVNVLRLATESGAVDTFHVDAVTNLPVRVEVVAPALAGEDARPIVIDFDEWQIVDGYPYPKVERVTAGTASGRNLYVTVRRNVEIAETVYDAPKEVKEASASTATSDRRGFQVLELEARPVALMSAKVKPENLRSKVASCLAAITLDLAEKGIATTAEPFTRFVGGVGDTLEIEVGIPVAARIESSGDVKSGELPGGRVAMTWHMGTLDESWKARAALAGWMKERGLGSRGAPWEVYLSDPDRTPSARRLHTQIFWPIEGEVHDEDSTVRPPDVSRAAPQRDPDWLPSARHELLARLAGEWSVSTSFAMVGGPSVTTNGSASIEVALGGRFLVERNRGSMMGQTVEGLRHYGFNDGAKRFEGTWMYTGSTSIMSLVGRPWNEGEPIVFDGSFAGANGQERFKISIEIASNERFTVRMLSIEADGSTGAEMAAVYTR